MAVQVPTPDQLRDVAGQLRLNLTDADIASFISLMRPSVAAYNLVDAMPDNLPAVRYPRWVLPEAARRSLALLAGLPALVR